MCVKGGVVEPLFVSVRVLYMLASIWMLRTPNDGQNMLLHEKRKKGRKKERKEKNESKICF